MKTPGLWIFLIAALLLKSPAGLAYIDDVQGVAVEDVWQAARKLLEPLGIKKADEKKKFVESRWVEDEVVRRNALFKGITSQVYRRRYRMKISLTESPNNVQVEVTGSFEEKPKQSPPTAPWRNLKKQTEDYDLEHDFFMRLLLQMAKDH